MQRFDVEFDPQLFPTTIRPWDPIDELPYKVHTNRELDLMLTASKPGYADWQNAHIEMRRRLVRA